MDGSLGMHLEIGLAIRRERLAEAERERTLREAEKNATPRVAQAIAAVLRRIGSMSRAGSDLENFEFATHVAMLSISATQ